MLYACKGVHTLFTGQRERKIERERKREGEKEGGRERDTEKEGESESDVEYVQNCYFLRNDGCLGTF